MDGICSCVQGSFVWEDSRNIVYISYASIYSVNGEVTKYAREKLINRTRDRSENEHVDFIRLTLVVHDYDPRNNSIINQVKIQRTYLHISHIGYNTTVRAHISKTELFDGGESAWPGCMTSSLLFDM